MLELVLTGIEFCPSNLDEHRLLADLDFANTMNQPK